MNCTKCNAEVSSNSKFCPKCGNPVVIQEYITSDAPSPAPAPSSTPAPAPAVSQLPQINYKMGTKTKLILIALVVIACAIGVYSYLTRPLTPNMVANKFMESMSKGDFAAAYSYFDDREFIGREFLDKSSFESAFAGKKISEFQIEPISEGDIPNDRFRYIMSIDGNRREGVLNLVNNQIKEGKDNWKIVPGDFITSTYISSQPGVKVRINNKELNMEGNSIEVPMFSQYSFQAVFEHPSIQTLKIEGQAGRQINGNDLQPSEKIKQQQMDIIRNFNQQWIVAAKDWNMSHFNGIVKENSAEWEEQSDFIESLKNSEMYRDATLKDIKFNEIYFENNLDKIYVKVDETWDSVDKNKDGEVSNERPDHLVKWTYRIEKQDDGKWLIVDTSERY